MNSEAPEQERIETAAAEWLARRDRGFTAEEAQAFAAWCEADPRHQAAVDDMEAVWGALDGLSALRSQQRAGGTAAVPSARSAPTADERRGSGSIVRWWPALAAAAAIVLMSGIWLWQRATPARAAMQQFATAVGEQLKVPLADGSEIQLNTGTRLRVQLAAAERRVVLEQGEAFFHVSKDPSRPFIISAGHAEVRVVGTQFVVRLREKQTDLTVTEGVVKFGPDMDHAVNVGAEHTAILGENSTPQVTTVDAATIARRLAWQTGKIIFDHAPLREAVAEFNRYHSRKLTLQGAAAEEVPVSGQFDAANVDGFVRLLSQTADVVVVRESSDEVVLTLR